MRIAIQVRVDGAKAKAPYTPNRRKSNVTEKILISVGLTCSRHHA